MLITLSHCAIVRTFLVAASGSAVGGSAKAAASAFLSWLFAMIMSASATFCFCASRASLVFSAIALPAATRLGFFCFMSGAVVGTVEVIVGSSQRLVAWHLNQSLCIFSDKIIFN